MSSAGTVTNEVYDVAIAGGGIVGAACALACAERGLQVMLAERSTIGGGTTSDGMGHVVVMDDSEAQFALTRFSQELWAKLSATLPPSCEYVKRGTLWIAADGEEMSAAEQKHDSYSRRGIPCRLLTAHELSEVEPNLAKGFAGALLVPDDAVVHPPAVALTLVDRARALGATVLCGKAVERLDSGDSLACGVMVFGDGSEVRARWMVNALGVASTTLSPDLPIRKRKGHMVITDRYPGFASHQLVELGYLKSAHGTTGDSVAFNIEPRPTGQMLIGSSRQYGCDDAKVDLSVLTSMMARAAIYMPAISGMTAMRSWTGFRAATPDKLPLIGPAIGHPSTLIATGHEGLGITTSLATGALIADMILGSKPAISSTPYLPTRFAGGDDHEVRHEQELNNTEEASA